jgi:hypothetical protein
LVCSASHLLINYSTFLSGKLIFLPLGSTVQALRQ